MCCISSTVSLDEKKRDKVNTWSTIHYQLDAKFFIARKLNISTHVRLIICLVYVRAETMTFGRNLCHLKMLYLFNAVKIIQRRKQCDWKEMQNAVLLTTLKPQGHEQNKPENKNQTWGKKKETRKRNWKRRNASEKTTIPNLLTQKTNSYICTT